jgi:hypothetical protein
MTMDISSIASSFSKSDRRNQTDVFNRAEFEEFIAALKESIDAAASAPDLNRAYLVAIDTIRSRLLSGKRLSCKMVRCRLIRRCQKTFVNQQSSHLPFAGHGHRFSFPRSA